jgi:hypothetical protein
MAEPPRELAKEWTALGLDDAKMNAILSERATINREVEYLARLFASNAFCPAIAA